MDAEFAVVGNAGHDLHVRGVTVNPVRGNSVAHPTETVAIKAAVPDEVALDGTVPWNRRRGFEHLATSTETGRQQ